MTFDLRLWISSSVKVNFIFIIRWMLRCVLVPSTKFLGSIEFEIWTIVWRKLKWRHNDVITYSNFIEFDQNSTKGIGLNDMLNFILIENKRTEIQSREVNRELWRKNGYNVTVTLTFYPRSPISLGFEPNAVINHLAKIVSKSVHPFGWNFVNKKTSDTHTNTHTHSENIFHNKSIV